MNSEDRSAVKVFLLRAERSLQEAEAIRTITGGIGCVNRLYYGCFYAVTALLITAGRHAKTHAAIRDLFNLEFVRPGIVLVAYGKFYGRMFKYRMDGDYSQSIEFTPDELDTWIGEARNFITHINALTHKRLEDL